MPKYYQCFSIICLYRHPTFPFMKDYNPVDEFVNNTIYPQQVKNPYFSINLKISENIVEELNALLMSVWRQGDDLYAEIESNLPLPYEYRYVPIVGYSIKYKKLSVIRVSIEKFKAAQGELSGALSRLLAVSENYPSLKTNAGFADLRVTLEGCENRISTERMKYNDLSRDFNKAIQFFPGNLLAGGFSSMPYFESEAGSEKAQIGRALV